MNTPKAIIFDFDGVIVNSAKTHAACWQAAYTVIAAKPLPPHAAKKLEKRAASFCEKYLTSLLPENCDPQNLVKTKNEILLANCHKIPTIPGIWPFLETLVLHAIPFGIASNASRAYVSATLQYHKANGQNLPDNLVMLGFEDYRAPKPSCEPFLRAAQKMAVPLGDHQKTYVFEDSPIGIHAALRAGMEPYGIGEGKGAQDLYDAGAKRVFRDFLEVVDCFSLS